jgi:hypothetical protein
MRARVSLSVKHPKSPSVLREGIVANREDKRDHDPKDRDAHYHRAERRMCQCIIDHYYLQTCPDQAETAQASQRVHALPSEEDAVREDGKAASTSGNIHAAHPECSAARHTCRPPARDLGGPPGTRTTSFAFAPLRPPPGPASLGPCASCRSGVCRLTGRCRGSQLAKVEQVRSRCPALGHVVALRGAGVGSLSVEQLIELGREIADEEVDVSGWAR